VTASDYVTLAVALLGITVGPWLAYQFALQQEQRQWKRNKRAAIYENLITVLNDEAIRLRLRPAVHQPTPSDLTVEQVQTQLVIYGTLAVRRLFIDWVQAAQTGDPEASRAAATRLMKQVRKEVLQED
jgi:hypothetical protein